MRQRDGRDGVLGLRNQRHLDADRRTGHARTKRADWRRETEEERDEGRGWGLNEEQIFLARGVARQAPGLVADPSGKCPAAALTRASMTVIYWQGLKRRRKRRRGFLAINRAQGDCELRR